MRNPPDALMLFAAGFGTRMGSLTKDRPKPLVPVAGRPLIDHALDLVTEAGISTIVANIHYRGGQIKAHLQDRPVLISDETSEILETGGGLRNALPLLGAGPVFTLNTDAVWSGPNPVAALRAAWDPARMSALLMLVPPTQAAGHRGTGDFMCAADGTLQRGPGFIYTGAQLIDTSELSDINETSFSLNLLWDRLLAQGRVHGIVYPGRWCDVGQPESIPLAEAMLDHTDVR